eukprot:6184110-Pleurochrysis_carterae.AAC.1
MRLFSISTLVTCPVTCGSFRLQYGNEARAERRSTLPMHVNLLQLQEIAEQYPSSLSMNVSKASRQVVGKLQPIRFSFAGSGCPCRALATLTFFTTWLADEKSSALSLVLVWTTYFEKSLRKFLYEILTANSPRVAASIGYCIDT